MVVTISFQLVLGSDRSIYFQIAAQANPILETFDARFNSDLSKSGDELAPWSPR